MTAHRWGGATFHDAGWNPRHIEGVEHFLFYNLERLTGRHFIHGQPVGLGIYVGSMLQENEPERMLAALVTGRRGHPARGDGRDLGGRRARRCGRSAGSSARPGSGTPSPTCARSTRASSTASGRASMARLRPVDGRVAMKLGITLPQGCDREYLGLTPRTRVGADGRGRPAGGGARVRVAVGLRPLPGRPAARGGARLRAVRGAGRAGDGHPRARLGHLVLAAAYRNAALTAKTISTLDVVSGGRVELGIGAGWKEDEWLAYGYGFPDAPERLAILADHLEIITPDARRRAAPRTTVAMPT